MLVVPAEESSTWAAGAELALVAAAEAGFAEGLGRPVIYTCRKDRWDKVENGERLVHFDTGHLVTILWEPDKLEEAGKQLTATIRATLPAEAQMTDA